MVVMIQMVYLKKTYLRKGSQILSVYFVTFKKVTFAICCILLHIVAYGCILLHIVEYNEANILDPYQTGIKTWHIQDQNLC